MPVRLKTQVTLRSDAKRFSSHPEFRGVIPGKGYLSIFWHTGWGEWMYKTSPYPYGKPQLPEGMFFTKGAMSIMQVIKLVERMFNIEIHTTRFKPKGRPRTT